MTKKARVRKFWIVHLFDFAQKSHKWLIEVDLQLFIGGWSMSCSQKLIYWIYGKDGVSDGFRLHGCQQWWNMSWVYTENIIRKVVRPGWSASLKSLEIQVYCYSASFGSSFSPKAMHQTAKWKTHPSTHERRPWSTKFRWKQSKTWKVIPLWTLGTNMQHRYDIILSRRVRFQKTSLFHDATVWPPDRWAPHLAKDVALLLQLLYQAFMLRGGLEEHLVQPLQKTAPGPGMLWQRGKMNQNR